MDKGLDGIGIEFRIFDEGMRFFPSVRRKDRLCTNPTSCLRNTGLFPRELSG
jgi:hypothetical protein